MRKNDWLTPEGTRDMLFEECAAKRTISERITKIFESYGYSEVITPGLEFYDVFSGRGRSIPQENMYKLVDGKNRLMVLRPDNTMPIARLAATRLKEEKLPLKLFYNQNIFMVNPKDSGRDDEISQCGIEILGGDKGSAALEALVLAAKALSACDEDYRLEIGDSGIFRELILQYGCEEKTAEDIRECIETKNYPALKAFDGDNPTVKALVALPMLFGGFEVFDEARKYLHGEVLKEKLNKLKKLCEKLGELIPKEKIRVDLGLVHKKDYYTGIIFRGYVEGYGQPVLSGGRYDMLLGEFGRDAVAVGFAVNVEAAAKVLLQKDRARFMKSPDVLVFGEDNVAVMKHCEKLISEDRTVYHFLGKCSECAAKYAKEHNIKRVDIVDHDGKITSEEV
ncbi:MAG: ATP phosphoribosyltransferase regulatory subunit [Oscillospiraceae bacterium]|nr:ATP phosphoribosyltransferase regulatory subunit [Oscillospiraceae bacterium]